MSLEWGEGRGNSRFSLWFFYGTFSIIAMGWDRGFPILPILALEARRCLSTAQ
jgi:hypothetical protein